MEFISTTNLAKEFNMPVNDMFAKLKSLDWIDRVNDKWILTEKGKQKGGQTRTSQKFGEFIVWPENLSFDEKQNQNKPNLLNSTALGKHFNISSQRINLILSEIGFIEKTISGWTITKLGKNIGGKQFEHETSGATYVLWPENILQNKNLLNSLNGNSSENEPIKNNETQNTTNIQTENNKSENFRDKFEAKHRTKDGHFVRSRAEVIIDDTLYEYGLVHAYEKKIPVEEEIYTDFYLPKGKVYIEFWGLENDQKYLERKKKKLEIYKKYDLNLIELNDGDVANLDDNLPKKLLKFDIKVY